MSNEVSDKMTFWKLIEKGKISVPNYQREYAQGRNNRRAELIRKNLVSSLFNSIESGDSLELDFIFGGEEKKSYESFNPVDGQQRLTILYLLHWYVFQRAGKKEELKTLGKNFSYATRTTSENYCKEICSESLKLDFSSNENEYVSLQIKNQSWFTGAMDSDPTVKSMLVVVDCIHEHFFNNLDYEKASICLTSDDCPITFYCLDLNKVLGISSGIRDLYIKMNARGIPLTDFELFKADLQKSEEENNRFDLLKEYLRDIDTEDTTYARVKIIGKFNNEYTNFFFQLIDDGKIYSSVCGIDSENNQNIQMFDTAMMNFINEVFRMNYFCEISKQGIPQKEYRTDSDSFRKMSGNEFISDFIRTRGSRYNTKYWKEGIPENVLEAVEKSMVCSFKMILNLLDEFTVRGINIDDTDEECQYALGAMLKKYAVDPQSDKVLPFRDSLIRMALYEFIIKFGIPVTESQKNAYGIWNRFIWKIDKNSDFKNFDEVVEALIGYRKILSTCGTCTFEAIMNAILDCQKCGDVSLDFKKVLSAPAGQQLEEEVCKSGLISIDSRWKKAIKEAEDYYNDCGQIWFLLDLSKKSDSYLFERFERAFEISKKIFNRKREVENVDSTILERALLAEKKYDKEDHLFSMAKSTTETKRFVGKDFSNHISHRYCNSNDDKEQIRYKITIDLLREMVDCDGNLNIELWLENYVKSGSSTVEWKNVFVKNSLLNRYIPGLPFKNGFQPDAWEEDGFKYTAVYTTENKRTYSGELYSFLLASKLCDKGVSVWYNVDYREEYLDSGFPSRNITVQIEDTDCHIGFMKGAFYLLKDGVVSIIGKENDVLRMLAVN